MLVILILITLFLGVNCDNCGYGNCGTTVGGKTGRICQDEWMPCLYCSDGSKYDCVSCDCGETEEVSKCITTLIIIAIVRGIYGCIICCFCCWCITRNRNKNQNNEMRQTFIKMQDEGINN